MAFKKVMSTSKYKKELLINFNKRKKKRKNRIKNNKKRIQI